VLHLDEVTVEDFQPLVGQLFDVSLDQGAFVLTQVELREAKLSGNGRADVRNPFRLLFEGPATEPLEQGMFVLENAAFGKLPIFIVPIRGDSETRGYEAVFN
jgi:hypothetical protein